MIFNRKYHICIFQVLRQPYCWFTAFDFFECFLLFSCSNWLQKFTQYLSQGFIVIGSSIPEFYWIFYLKMLMVNRIVNRRFTMRSLDEFCCCQTWFFQPFHAYFLSYRCHGAAITLSGRDKHTFWIFFKLFQIKLLIWFTKGLR